MPIPSFERAILVADLRDLRRRRAHRDRAFRHLWACAPELRTRARHQSAELQQALRGRFRAVQGYWMITPAGIEGDHLAWTIGHHAGRLMALRLEAYDREPDLYARKLRYRRQ